MMINRLFPNLEVQAQVRNEIFGHADWAELDRGTLPREQAVRQAADRTGLTISAVTELMQHVPLTLVVIPDTLDLLYRLKARGHRLFCLSNMHVASIEHLERTYTFWEIFDGSVISCRVHLIKPEPAIYTFLLDTYGLNRAEAVFIDDTEINLVAATQLGIRTIHFQSPGQCEAKLKTLGVF